MRCCCLSCRFPPLSLFLSLSLFIATKKKKKERNISRRGVCNYSGSLTVFGPYTLVSTRASTLARGAERLRCLQLERRRCLADEEKSRSLILLITRMHFTARWRCWLNTLLKEEGSCGSAWGFSHRRGFSGQPKVLKQQSFLHGGI